MFLTACTTDIPLTQAEGQAIHTVTLTSVANPNSYIYTGPNTSMMLFGDGVAGQRLETVITDNQIDITQIVKEQLIKDLDKDYHIQVRNEGPADAQLKVRILLYGFTNYPFILQRTVRPYLSIDATLTKDNRIVWYNKTVDIIGLGTTRYYFSDLLQDPQLIRKSWSYAASIVGNKLLATI